MPQSPEDKRPACAVPQAGCEKYEKPVEPRPRLPLSVAAERNIQVVAEPAGQRNVPAAPELLDGGRSVRIIEVFAEMEAEHASETDGHIAVAGKIEVDLQRVANGARPSCQHADLSGRQREHRVRHLTERVRQQQLFAQAADKPADAECGLLRSGAAAVDLLLDVMVFDDRPGDQLREKRDVQQHLLERVRDHFRLPVHVNNVA